MQCLLYQYYLGLILIFQLLFSCILIPSILTRYRFLFHSQNFASFALSNLFMLIIYRYKVYIFLDTGDPSPKYMKWNLCANNDIFYISDQWTRLIPIKCGISNIVKINVYIKSHQYWFISCSNWYLAQLEGS